MIIEIDFESDEAIYMQLRNQIIMGIAMSVLHEGDTLPSVRQLADEIGINMHTVNKAYNILKQEGYLRVDHRKGTVVSLDRDRIEVMEELKKQLRLLLAGAACKNISKEDIHELIDGSFSISKLCGNRTYSGGTFAGTHRSCSKGLIG